MRNKRAVVERVVSRIYKDSLKKRGQLPSGSEVRVMEQKGREAAIRVEERKKRA